MGFISSLRGNSCPEEILKAAVILVSVAPSKVDRSKGMVPISKWDAEWRVKLEVRTLGESGGKKRSEDFSCSHSSNKDGVGTAIRQHALGN